MPFISEACFSRMTDFNLIAPVNAKFKIYTRIWCFLCDFSFASEYLLLDKYKEIWQNL